MAVETSEGRQPETLTKTGKVVSKQRYRSLEEWALALGARAWLKRKLAAMRKIKHPPPAA